MYLDASVEITLRNGSLPSDHGYHLFGALSRAVQALHTGEKWGLHLIRNGKITLRLPESMIDSVMSGIINNTFAVGTSQVSTSVAWITCNLEPSGSLYSPYVTIKNSITAEDFYKHLDRSRFKVMDRKTMKIAAKTVIGYSVMANGLSPEESIQLQVDGVGGRRHMGGGMFCPC